MQIRVLGGFEVRTSEGGVLALESARAASLLAYLVLHREAPHPRQRLAYLLWPDSTESQARTNLRHLLHTMRRAKADQFVEVTPRTLRWRTDTVCWIDVAAFDRLLDHADGSSEDVRLAALKEAVDAYVGDLLAGTYDDWVLAERERLRARYLEALDQLTTLLHTWGDHAAATGYAARLLREDPLREPTYRLLMAAHNARGDRARALRTYHLCASTLERELGVAPSPETQAAYAALLPTTLRANPRQVQRPSGPPLVGRAAERNRLTAAWGATESGGAQLIVLTGEPGIGKTRLAEEFGGWCARRGAAVAAARAHAAEGSLTYAPVVAWLRSSALRPLARLGTAHLRELVRLLPELATEMDGLTPPEPLPEDEHRQLLFDAVAHAMFSLGRPVVLIADDLHRFDQESLRLLHYLLRADPQARLLVVATARPEEADHDHPTHAMLGGLRVIGRVTEIELARLTRTETATLASRITGQALTERDAERLFRESEGNPLFLVESLRAGWPGDGSMSPKVQAVIEARLARLSEPAREVVGVAAAIGRDFSAEVLLAAGGMDEDTVVTVLDELWTRRIIREQGDDAYDFAHDKIREVAYQGMSRTRRRHHHRRIAKVLARSAAAAADAASGEIARHYEHAGVAAEAARWYRKAADGAARLHANVEAVGLLNHARDLVRTLPESAARDGLELEVLTALPSPLAAVEGFSAPALHATHSRALEVIHQLDGEPEPPLVRSIAMTSLTRSDFDSAQRFGEQLRERGERESDDVLVVEGAYVLGIAAFWQARLEAAREHFELAVRRYRPEHRGIHLLRYGQDTHAVCISRLANTLWFLGTAAEATGTRDTALALTEESGHPFSRAVVLFFAGLLAIDMNDEAHLRRYTAELIAMGHGARQIYTGAQALEGYVEVLDGNVTQGLARCRAAVAAQRGGELAPGAHATCQRVLLAACVAAGDVRCGIDTAEGLLSMGGAGWLWQTEAEQRRAELLAGNT